MRLCDKIITGWDSFTRLLYCNNGIIGTNFKSHRELLLHKVAVYSFSHVAGTNTKSYQSTDFVTFENMIEMRRKEAQRSLIVQVNSQDSCADLYEYCQSKAPINKMFYYTCSSNNFVLVEFKNKDAARELCRYNCQGHSVESPFVWFAAVKDKKQFLHKTKGKTEIPLLFDKPVPSNEEVNEWLSNSLNLSDEMEVLFQSMKLSDLGIRLRMVCARQLEMAFSGLYPTIKALPFGSTVNSFGKEGCDLDLVIRYSDPEEDSGHQRLIYHTKNSSTLSRGQIQRQMELLGDVLQLHIPGATGVKRILGARVPIIKYSHEFTGIDTDISLTNLSAVYMSELLYLFSSLDPFGLRLVFTIKTWAKAVGLTSPSPGRWITNFSLTLLCMFYLQIVKRLPSVDHLIRESRKEDERYADEINCTFLRDIRHLNFQMNNSESPEALLKGFFNFYQNFDFDNKAINLCRAEVVSKPDYSPLYIVNPLERSLNVSKNVSVDEIERFRIETRNATWALESKGSLKELFGRAPYSSMNRKYVSRLVAVRDLFS